jgi:hypothetical protein
MQWLKTIFRELLAVFVDDGSFAAAILVWLALLWLLARAPYVPATWNGWVLFAGLAILLIESALRRSRR